MLTLILDTAYNLKVAIIDNDKVVADLIFEEKRADRYMQIIDNSLKKCGYAIEQVNNIAVNIGPGSFTGLRVAVSVVKGLAFGKNIDIYTFTSFDFCDALKKENIILPAFSDFVYVKYSDGAMDCVKTDELKEKAFVTNFDEIISTQNLCGIYIKKVKTKDPIEVFKGAKKVEKLTDIRPVYLRKSQAEIALEEKKKKI